MNPLSLKKKPEGKKYLYTILECHCPKSCKDKKNWKIGKKFILKESLFPQHKQGEIECVNCHIIILQKEVIL